MTSWIKDQDSFTGDWWQRVIAWSTPYSQWFAEWCRSCNRSSHTWHIENTIILLVIINLYYYALGNWRQVLGFFPVGWREFQIFVYLFIIYMLSQRSVSQLDLHCCNSFVVVPRHCLTDICTHTRRHEPRDGRLIFVTLLQKLLVEALCMLKSQGYGKAS